ncbi:P-loop containing nucleoside triphosphate hydrolase protein [Paraphysoderma sedebokerense]|nr:P-loop containing nucleoside triphosphate hydrolase protein [Paraphysoderma sedebokerense]
MPKKNSNTLGKAIIRNRFGNNRPRDGDTTLHTTELNDGPAWVKLQSVTQERDLEEFLNTAELAGTEFTAEKLNIKILPASGNSNQNPFLLTPEEERATLRKHEENKERLTIPRRPQWNEKTTKAELDRLEKDSFLEWRRGLAELQDVHSLLLTPFERNLEVWRQLWRVIERSDLIVQIVDARNPLAFRSTDLEKYVKEVDSRKRNLLLVNKADMLTLGQRIHWANYFEQNGIPFSFFSAAIAIKSQEEENKDVASSDDMNDVSTHPSQLWTDDHQTETENSDSMNSNDPRLRILSPGDLIDLFMRECPDPIRPDPSNPERKMIGLVGYPNVGKSSTINALLGEKKVSVSSTPGKTKHFQTLNLTPTITLCDCPGLVFPSFATTKADMVCNGVLPIDQLREFTGPASLIVHRVPRHLLELIYGIRIKVLDEQETGRTQPTAEEFLRAYAISRGFMKSGQGNPDESRAARIIFKDYVNGKILFVHPPPSYDSSALEFNKELFARVEALFSKLRPKASSSSNASSPSASEKSGLTTVPRSSGSASHKLDTEFFEKKEVKVGIKGKFASNDFSRTQFGFSANGNAPAGSGKKQHKKGKKHVKVRMSVKEDF